MDIFQFLKTDIAELPKRQTQLESFPLFLEKQYETFIKELSEQLVGEKDWLSKETLKNIPFIQTLSDVIIKTIETYYDGAPSDAYEYFAEWLFKNQESLKHLKTIEMKKNDFQEVYPLFRMRVHNSFNLTPEQMFHIPFQERHKVSTQRYSIPGYPCIYLGASSFVCWKELGYPAFDSIYLVRFEPTRDLNLLDLAYTPFFLSQMYGLVNEEKEDHRQFFLNQVLFWPLKCACMVQSMYAGAPFKPEYIIPQFLLQYIRNDKSIDGVRYYSTCLDKPYDFNDLYIGCNYAFPVRTQASFGHCEELKKLFNVTEVMPWQILSADKGRPPLSRSGRELKNYRSVISIVKDQPKLYRESIFGHIDDYGVRIGASPL